MNPKEATHGVGPGDIQPNVFEERALGEYGNVSIGVYAFSEGLSRIAAPGRDAVAIRRDAGTLRMLAVISDGESTVPGDSLLDQQAILTAGTASRSIRYY